MPERGRRRRGLQRHHVSDRARVCSVHATYRRNFRLRAHLRSSIAGMAHCNAPLSHTAAATQAPVGPWGSWRWSLRSAHGRAAPREGWAEPRRDFWNDHLDARDAAAAEYEHVAVEVPPGRPQLAFFDQGDQWMPRGHVLRCVVMGSNGEPDEPFLTIDERDFTPREFARMVGTFGGWGMRTWRREGCVSMTRVPRVEDGSRSRTRCSRASERNRRSWSCVSPM